MSDVVLKALELQSQACAALGAPFSAALLNFAKEDAADGGVVATLLEPWAETSVEKAVSDAIALRVLASLHLLVLGGHEPDLAACYPPLNADASQAWPIAKAALLRHPALIANVLAHEPQTNEVRRSTCLLAGFLKIARETGLPLRCFEIGASAGLNSLWDKFFYRIGGDSWGDPASPVVLESRWEGAAPSLGAKLAVIERRACDRRPVDLRKPDDASRLLAYVWAEQVERLDRLRSAIALNDQAGVQVEAESASNWAKLAAPIPGAATVLFHSIVWQYIPPTEQALLRAVIEDHGRKATREAPFAWLRMEFEPSVRQFQLRLTTWPGGEEQILAEVHPHGEFAIWR